MELQDAEIITEVLNGSKDQYALLMRKYNQRVYRICKGYLTNEAEIEDVMQDAYVKAYQHLSGFANRSQFITWMTRITINECLQRLKKAGRMDVMDMNEENHELMNITDTNDPEKQSLTRELKTLLENAVGELPEKYRSVFVMREIEKLSTAETSIAMDISESNVKIRLTRAKELLRNSLLESYRLEDLFEFNLVRCDRIAANVLARI